MNLLRNIVTTGVLILSFVTISYGGTITGSRTGATDSRIGIITGSRSGTITGSTVGTISGSKVGIITGSSTEPPKTIIENLYSDVVIRLLSVVLNGGW